MEFLNPFIKRAICQYDFDHSLRFFSRAGDIAHELLENGLYADFDLSLSKEAPRLALRNLATKTWLTVQPTSMHLSCNDPGNAGAFAETAQQLRKIHVKLGQRTIRRLGIRLFYVSQVTGASFERLNDRISEKLFNRFLIDKVRFNGKSWHDLAVVLDFKNGANRCHLEVGPVSRSESSMRFEEDPDTLPEVALLVNADCFVATESSSEEIPELRSHIEATDKFVAHLTGEIIAILGDKTSG